MRFKAIMGPCQIFAATLWLLLVPLSPLWSLPVTWCSLLHPSTRWLALLYLVWMYYDRRRGEQGGRIGEWFRKASVWRHFRDYFPVSLVKTAELDPAQNYLLCSFPHGIVPAGIFCALNTEALGVSQVFPGMTVSTVVLHQNFFFPILRELLMASGGVSSSERSLEHVLRDPRGGRMLVLVVGGAAEAELTRPDRYHIVLRRRKGFCRVALRQGVPLVPVFTFGENRVYSHVRWPALRRVQEFVRKKVGVSPLLPYGPKGRGFFLPNSVPLAVVVGAPVPVERTLNPSAEQIKELNQRFEKALVQLFERYKPVYHPNEDIKLIIE